MKQEVKGTNNKVLEIDLGTQRFETVRISEEDRRMYIGGKGLATKLMYDRMKIGADPLGEDNILVITTGVLMGTGAPVSARFSAVSKSPLTGLLCHSSCGGPFGNALKTEGWDGLIIKGKAKEKTRLVITADGVEFHNADDLWGKGASETQEILGKKTSSCVIGPAGENLVRYGNIVSGERFLGRGGLGAVMGSKNLKAISAIGKTYKILPVNDEKYQKKKKRAQKYLKASPYIENYKLYGTNANTNFNNVAGILPIKNFTEGKSDEAYKISGEHIKVEHQTKFHTCKYCQIQCSKKGTFDSETLPVPEFETSVLLGSNLGIYDTVKIANWNRICGDMGMDTISAGGTLAWVMEATEKGLVQSDLKFGSDEGITEALNDIAHMNDFGAEMGMGSRYLSDKYGGKDFAIQVKGLEMAAYDPRGSYGHGLSYAVANRGACHLSTSLMVLEVFMHFLKPYTTRNKPTMVKYFENFFAGINSMHTCVFTAFGYTTEPPAVKFSPTPILRQLMTYTPKLALASMDVSVYSQLWSSITGQKMSMWEFLKAGERIHVLERYINTLEGVNRKDDTLPGRLLNEGIAWDKKNRSVPLEKMLDRYYKERGFDSNGIPTDRLLNKLGIQKLQNAV